MQKWTWLILAIGVAGCAERKTDFTGRTRAQAPRNAQDVGLLIDHASKEEIAAALEEFPQAQVRELNPAHGSYEIFGADQARLAHLIGKNVTRNQFFEFHSIPAPDGLSVPGWPTCRTGRPGPTATLTAENPRNLNGATIEIGTTIKVNTRLSADAGGVTTGLRSAIAIIPPDLSAAGKRMATQSDLEFVPDTVGLYQLVSIVQDSTNACAMDLARFVVTSNARYAGPTEGRLSVDLTQFKHLDLVDASASWDLSQGEGILIAVIDTGVNYNHPSLAGNIMVNTREIPGNGIDDDNNGFVDDVVGFDFANGDAFPFDDDGHGSHVAGLAASRHFGLAKQAKILPIKALSSVGGDVGTISAALRYAVDRGARVVNMSLGAPGLVPHPAIVAAMNYAESKGVVVVTSAGNGDPQTGLGFSIDEIPFFPAGLPNANVITVASFDSSNALSTYSNFGKNNVDVVAPGGSMPNEPLFSCTAENPRHRLLMGMSGTSMAAPVVSGLVAQMLSLQPRLTVAEVKDILMTTGKASPELAPITGSGRHIHARETLEKVHSRNVLF